MKYVMVLALFLASSLCVAAEGAKRGSVDELMNIMDVDAMVDSMYAQVEGMLQGMGEQLGVQPDEKPIFDSHNAKMVALMRKEMSWEKMKEPMTDIYMKNFTEEEVQGMLTFYKSDIGKATLKKLPIVMQQSMQISQNLMQALMPEIQRMAGELQADLEKHRKEKAAKQ